MRPLRTVVLLATFSISVACSSIGPPTLDRDRLDYSSAISSSWQRQMLLNIVKLRYGDTPLFLEVDSVINQYTVEASAGAEVAPNSREDLALIGGKYIDRPTVTYVPLSGQAFTKRLLTPVSPVSLFALAQAGWPIDFIFHIAVRKVNGVSNLSGGLLATPADPRFDRLLEAMRRVQESGNLSLLIEGGGREQASDEDSAVVLVVGEPTPEIEDDLRFIRETLGLQPRSGGFRISYGGLASSPNEIAVLSRSALEIMMELGQSIKVPDEDVESGRTTQSLYHETATAARPLITIGVSKDRPESALTAVRYRDSWFSIDDRDLWSKRTMTFMLFLFSLTDTGTGGSGPVVTIGAG